MASQSLFRASAACWLRAFQEQKLFRNMSTRTSKSAFDDKTQRKRPSCESLTHQRPYKYTKVANNLDHSPDLNPPEAFTLSLSQQALSDLNRLNRSSSSEPLLPMSPEACSSESDKDSELTDEPEGAVNAEHSSYLTGLMERGIFFADDEPDKYPSNIKDLIEDISTQRDNYVAPSPTAARELRILARKAPNESELEQHVLPMIAPIRELGLDGNISTTSNQKWHRTAMVQPHEPQVLTAPQPDRTVGWSIEVVNKYREAVRCLATTVCPVSGNSELAIPLFTIEVKGNKGSTKVASLQNLHNGATMLANLLRVWNACLGENTDGFFNKVHAMSLELTAETVHLSCYWARKENGEIIYYGRSLYGWILSSDEDYKKAHRYTRNALEWVREQAFEWLCPALSVLGDKLNTGTSLSRTPHTSPDQGSGKRPRFVTSASSLTSTPVKKKQRGTGKTSKALRAAKKAAARKAAAKKKTNEEEASAESEAP